MILVMASFIMGRIPATCEVDGKLQGFYMLLPSYSLGYGFIKVNYALLHVLLALLISFTLSID